jgi:hypothetical protein
VSSINCFALAREAKVSTEQKESKRITMKHLGVNYMLIASVVMAAPASAGNSSSKANKITSSISDTEQETSTSSLDASSKSAKASDSSSGNSGKGSKVSYNFMSMQHHDAISMEHQSIGRSGKVGKAFSADGKGAKSDPEAFQSGKSGKYQSLSLQYIETLAPSLIPAPSAVPSLYPSFAAIEGKSHV